MNSKLVFALGLLVGYAISVASPVEAGVYFQERVYLSAMLPLLARQARAQESQVQAQWAQVYWLKLAVAECKKTEVRRCCKF